MTADTIHPALWIFIGLVAIALLALGYGILSHKIDLGKIHTALTTDKDVANAWIQAEFAKLHSRLDTVQTQNQMIHTAVQMPVQLVTAQVPASPTPKPNPLPQVLPPASIPGIQTQWGFAAYRDFPTYAAFAQLVMLTGRGLSDDEIRAWMAATGNGDPRIFTAGGIDATKATGASSVGTEGRVYSTLYESHRNAYPAGQMISHLVVAPKDGKLWLQVSGRGGVPIPGADSSAHLDIRVSENNQEIGRGDEGNYATFQATKGQLYAFTVLSDKNTVEDITLNG